MIISTILSLIIIFEDNSGKNLYNFSNLDDSFLSDIENSSSLKKEVCGEKEKEKMNKRG